MNIYKVTRLSRPMDWRHRSNLIAVALPVLGGIAWVAWNVYRHDDWDPFGGLVAAFAGFLAWAVARELDPDRPSTATFALVLGVAAAFGSWEPALLVCAIALLGLRVLAGTVGGELKPLDLVILTVAAAYCGTRVDAWVVVLLLVLAVLDARPRGYSVVTVGMLVSATAAGYLSGVDFPTNPMVDEELLWGLVTLVAIALSIRSDRIRSRTDIFNHPILWPKVRAARVMAGFVVIGGIIGSDSEGVVLMSPVLAALVATAVFRTLRPA